MKIVPFEALRGYVNHDTLKALTFKPFQLKAMSEVQKRVLRLMPYLAGGELKGVAREAGGVDGGEGAEGVTEDAEGVKRGREDLLVKVRLFPCSSIQRWGFYRC